MVCNINKRLFKKKKYKFLVSKILKNIRIFQVKKKKKIIEFYQLCVMFVTSLDLYTGFPLRIEFIICRKRRQICIEFVWKVQRLYKINVPLWKFHPFFFYFSYSPHSLSSSLVVLLVNICVVLNRLEVTWYNLPRTETASSPILYIYSFFSKTGSDTGSMIYL